MELKKIWEVLWRRKWLIIQAFLVILTTSVVGSLYLPSIYASNVILLTGSTDTASALMENLGFQVRGSSGQNEIGVETHVELLQEDMPMLQEVIERLQIRNRKNELMEPNKLLKSFPILASIFPKPHIGVSLVSDSTNLIEITSTAPDPETAALLPNTVAELYLQETLERRKEEYKSALIFIEDQIEVTKKEYHDVLTQVRDFQRDNAIIDLDEEIRTAVDKMAALLTEKGNTIIQLHEVEAKLLSAIAYLARQDSDKIAASTIQDNAVIEQLKITVNSLEQDLTAALIDKQASHPDVQIIKKKLMQASQELHQELEFFKTSATSLQNLQSEKQSLSAHLDTINQHLESYQETVKSFPDLIFRDSQLQLKYTMIQNRYSTLLETLHEVGIAEAMTVSDVKVIKAAVVPDFNSPDSPNIVVNAALGCILGGLFALFLGFLVDYLDDAIRSPEDIKGHKLTNLGLIPRFKTWKKKSALIVGKDPKSPICEAFRTLRNSIKFASLDAPINSIVVTSSSSGEGKTTVSANLAISVAREGKRVLLIDCDLRRPSLHEIFDIPNTQGLTTILAGDKTIEEVTQFSDQGEEVNILTCGPIPPDPAKLLESKRMQQLIEECGQKFDFLVIDTPPVLVATDSIVLSKTAGGTIFVLTAGKTSTEIFSHAQDLLQQANVKVLGTVFNKMTTGRTSYYSYYYKYGYYK